MVWCATPEKGRSWGAGQVLRLLMGIPKLGAQARKGGAPTRLASGHRGQSDLAGASVAGVKAPAVREVSALPRKSGRGGEKGT